MDDLDALIAKLQSDDIEVQYDAIEALIRSDDPRVVEPLIGLLDHEDRLVVQDAIVALEQIGDDRAIDPLLEKLDSDNEELRVEIAMTLGNFDARRVAPPLMNLAKNDPHPNVRAAAIDSLGVNDLAKTDENIQAALIAALDDFASTTFHPSYFFVAEHARQALKWVDVSFEYDWDNWNARLGAKLGPDEAIGLLSALIMQGGNEAAQDQTIEKLIHAGKSAVKPLVDALQLAMSARTRGQVVRALGEIGDKTAVSRLLSCLEDEDAGVWSQAVSALAKLDAGKPLKKRLRKTEGRAKNGMALALWRLKRDEKAFPLVLQALEDDELVVRSTAIITLWKQPDERAVAPLLQRLTQEDDLTMQKYTVQALRSINTPEAQQAVEQWLRENQEQL